MAFSTNLLWQNDSRWADHPVGYDPQTINNGVVLLTSLTMAGNGYGFTETPASVSEKLAAVGGFAADTAYIIPGMLPAVFPRVRPQAAVTCDPINAPPPVDRIDATLVAGDHPRGFKPCARCAGSLGSYL